MSAIPKPADHPPGREHVDRLIAFARSWDARAPFLIHCWAGISRSMASAFTVLCDRLGRDREIEIATGDAPPRAPCQPEHASGAPCRRSLGTRRPHGDGPERDGPAADGGRRRHHGFSIGQSVNPGAISIGLSAAIVSVEGERPCALVVAHDGSEDALPFGPFDPGSQRTLEQGLRKWVGEQTHFDLGYTEQLYTFGDRGRHLPATPDREDCARGVGRISGADAARRG